MYEKNLNLAWFSFSVPEVEIGSALVQFSVQKW